MSRLREEVAGERGLVLLVSVGPEVAAVTGAQLQAQARAWKRRHRLPDVRVGEIIAEVAQLHDTTTVAIRGACRVPQVVEARRDAARRLRTRGLTLRVVGLALGGRHHTSVLALLRRAG